MGRRFDDLVALMHQQRAELDQLRKLVAELPAGAAAGTPLTAVQVSAPLTAPDPTPEQATDAQLPRRRLIRLLGAGAAVGATAVGTTVLTAGPAAAAAGDPLIVGQSNDSGTVRTGLAATVPNTYTFLAVNDEDAIGAIGVYGVAGPSSGNVNRDANQTWGAGVIGDSHNQYGVSGTSYQNSGVYGDSVLGYGVAAHSSVSAAVFGGGNTGVFGSGENGPGVKGFSAGVPQPGVAGVVGSASSNPAVLGTSDAHHGVVGLTQSTAMGTFPLTGVLSQAAGGRGVTGIATTGSGTVGQAGSGVGVRGTAAGTGLGGQFGGGRAQLHLVPSPTVTGHPTTGNHLVGELFMDKVGALYLCKAAGTPGTWKLIG